MSHTAATTLREQGWNTGPVNVDQVLKDVNVLGSLNDQTRKVKTP